MIVIDWPQHTLEGPSPAMRSAFRAADRKIAAKRAEALPSLRPMAAGGGRLLHRWPLIIACLLFMPAACTLVESGIDRAAGGPSVPADTEVAMPAPPPGTATSTATKVQPGGPLQVTVTEAILLALENNRALAVQRLNPSIRQTFEDEERALFDPLIGGEISTGRVEGERLARSGSQTEAYTTDTLTGGLDLSQYFPTGTTVALAGSTLMTDSSLYDNRFYTTRLGVEFTQSLLRGFGSDANLADLRQARMDTRLSEYELRGFSESLVAEVERTFWAYALARRQIEIFEESLKIARQQLSDTRELIAVGRLAATELAAVQAEVAAQEQGLINARSESDTTRLRLLRLLNPPGADLWQRQIDLIYQPRLPDITLEEVTVYVQLAGRMRPLLNEARLRVMRGDLELVKTRNGLLPVMDLFITLGKTGYSEAFGDSVGNIADSNYDALVGLRFEYPLFNREAEGVNRRALLSQEQAADALANLEQLVELDVRAAYIEVNRAKQQIAASSATRSFEEEKLRTESEKFKVGKSTNFLVTQAQRDLLISRISEVQALANYLTALVDLYLKDGSLLQRRGIAAPGREPVTLR